MQTARAHGFLEQKHLFYFQIKCHFRCIYWRSHVWKKCRLRSLDNKNEYSSILPISHLHPIGTTPRSAGSLKRWNTIMRLVAQFNLLHWIGIRILGLATDIQNFQAAAPTSPTGLIPCGWFSWNEFHLVQFINKYHRFVKIRECGACEMSVRFQCLNSTRFPSTYALTG